MLGMTDACQLRRREIPERVKAIIPIQGGRIKTATKPAAIIDAPTTNNNFRSKLSKSLEGRNINSWAR
jgi:hypothetical protein